MLNCRYSPSILLGALLAGQLMAAELTAAAAEPDHNPFSRLLAEDRFVGPGVLSVAEETKTPPSNVLGGAVLPGNFQPVSTLVLVADKLAVDFPDAFTRIVAAVPRGIELVGLIADEHGRAAVRKVLAEHRLPLDRLRLLRVPTNTIWIRDFGPVVVHRNDGTRIALDFEYRRRSGARSRDLDNAAAATIGRHLGIPVRGRAMELEAGNLLSNGRGLLVTTTAAVNANISRGRTAKDVTQRLHECFGCRRIVMLEPLYGEPTGHVDVFACFVDTDTIVLGEYAESADPLNSLILERNAAILSKVRTSKGPLRVVRLPMPSNEDGRWRSYTNSVFVDRVLLVPNYGGNHARTDKLAEIAFQRLLPERRIISIDASRLVRRDGALRCVTLSVPQRLEQGLETRD